MKLRLSILSLILLPALAGVALACNGEARLSLEDYLQRLETIRDDATTQSDKLSQEFGEKIDQASTDDEELSALRDYFAGSATLFSDRIDEIKGLNPPKDAEDPHNELLDAQSDGLELLRAYVSRLDDVESRAAAEKVFEDEFQDDLDKTSQRADDACRALQKLADDNGIDVDLGCAEDGAASPDGDETPAATAEPSASPTVAPTPTFEIVATIAAAATATAVAEQPPGSGDGVGQTKDNPVPAGKAFTVPEGWKITVVDYVPNANEMVLAEDPSNEPPDPGFKYVIVRVRAKNVSAGEPGEFVGAGTFDANFGLRLTGSRGSEYDTFTRSCGVIPDSFGTAAPATTGTGGTLEGNVCFQVVADETGFVMFTSFLLGGNPTYFALK